MQYTYVLRISLAYMFYYLNEIIGFFCKYVHKYTGTKRFCPSTLLLTNDINDLMFWVAWCFENFKIVEGRWAVYNGTSLIVRRYYGRNLDGLGYRMYVSK